MDEYKTQLFREAMGNYPSGITVITTTDDKGNPVGIAANSFSSVSIDPLLIQWSVGQTSSSFDIFKDSKQFAVHLLAGDQAELVKIFAQENGDRFGQVNWGFSDNQLPIVEGAYATFECDTFKAVEAGDHTILIGSVKDIKTNLRNPLLYHQRIVGPLPSEFHEPI